MSKVAEPTKKTSRSQNGSQNITETGESRVVLLQILQSILQRYKEAGGAFSVIDLPDENGCGVFLPGVSVNSGEFTENTHTNKAVSINGDIVASEVQA